MQQLDQNLERLLDMFEEEVKPYDKLSILALVLTPVAVVLTVIFGWLLNPLPNDAVLRSFVEAERTYWIIGAIIAALVGTKLLIIYTHYKKHQISNNKYKPLSGGRCMCDLSQLRYHMRRLEKSSEGERIRHVRMINYYKQRLVLA